MRFKRIVAMFRNGSVCVVGQRGTGKDMMYANVIARRKRPYISHIDYKCKDAEWHKLDIQKLDMGGNTYRDLLNNTVKFWKHPYPMGADLYFSDIGIMFPSQYCNELNKEYKSIPLFLALSRQIAGGASCHLNTQSLGRAWDKFREQSDQYILCLSCHVILGWVFQKIIIYERADSCQARIRPCRVHAPIFGRGKTDVKIHLDNFYNQHGKVEGHFLIYRNRSKYNTNFFKEVFENGIKTDQTIQH